ncbi:MAG: hypothetical protein OXC01_08365 [Immundisolibacterales bacterium]|nr:hypothetical protein [Immundisolibacterales bacterium]
MPDPVFADRPLSEQQQSLLAGLLDALIPASRDGSMPSAADVDFKHYLSTQAADFVADLTSILGKLNPAFPDLSLSERCERLTEFSANEPQAFQNLLSRVYDCYYQDDRVRSEIGVVTGAVFPQGNQIIPGDLALLDPVIENASRHGYRRNCR